ncbi:3-phosphoserine/phosphohydroxythreonine transaminase [Ferrovum sp. PN-J185]|uniref:3-phosphoserine/phosphohydroxythreonine transaminase n=1 Tax=Ferrovum sp. PN-J185 TaxID=1356306 RepID=UPI00079A7B7A|nr:3-phosphoserine/phosphohydroxythreonine transaminase [Ferrovum sp. PN-J185]KXW56485.1 phosphoserine aminotransferase [Ferrovum sp. PN-J185]MCC6068166.1 3-phosphoserine/phosphohydroxythreonine transaminase [Ferrovum sp. PN-J185]MDE1891721.1 3-phosphoserine/phosphohydroxythreonine transaminase [Betaproteobacteria bacterium]MDE2056437.1 3-phosphoserine/phosphohydroxythreonine transaminase [Betaproteobacteria bacterium]
MAVYNFSAGPAVLPAEVIKQAQVELNNWRNSGMSVMEMSHRGPEFMSIHEQAKQDLVDLLAIPSNYKVLFLQGGASQQFSMVPLNLAVENNQVDYLHTGEWSKKAIAEAKKTTQVNIVANAEDKNFSYVPDFSTWKLNPNAAYLHITPNETIGGVEFYDLPDTHQVPVVADMSSTILSRPIDVSRYGIIYAGAQKNMGIAGLTTVIIREDLIGHAKVGTPAMLDYKIHVDNDSMYNTPPAFSIYMAGLVFKWLKANGGLEAMAKTNQHKAQLVYDAIDNSNQFYRSPVAISNRSWMNIPFTLKDEALDKPFLKQAEERGLLQLKGHRSVGGMRASIYNAMPVDGVVALTQFMKEFQKQHG